MLHFGQGTPQDTVQVLLLLHVGRPTQWDLLRRSYIPQGARAFRGSMQLSKFGPVSALSRQLLPRLRPRLRGEQRMELLARQWTVCMRAPSPLAVPAPQLLLLHRRPAVSAGRQPGRAGGRRRQQCHRVARHTPEERLNRRHHRHQNQPGSLRGLLGPQRQRHSPAREVRRELRGGL